MTEEISYIPEPPETFEDLPQKKSKKTLWIILAVVAVIILCCCLAGALFIWVIPWDEIDWFAQIVPFLNLV